MKEVRRPCDSCFRNRSERFFSGPRGHICLDCQKKKRRATSRASHVQRTYSITEAQYQEIYEAQGGRCAICQRATGASKRLAVDHDHRCCAGPVSCGRCVRGLCCGPCNQGVLGHLRDDPAALRRAADYLENPPAHGILH